MIKQGRKQINFKMQYFISYLPFYYPIFRTGLRATDVVAAGDLVPAGPGLVTPALETCCMMRVIQLGGYHDDSCVISTTHERQTISR